MPLCTGDRGSARDLCDALHALGNAPVRFVPPSAQPDGMGYESYIHAHGSVPTRPNLHDVFNALCWMRFPESKRSLNRLQAEAIAAAGPTRGVRGRLRDALTLFDENGLLLSAPEPLWAALQARDWHRLFVTQRSLWADAQVVTFGHALTEKLVEPYASITAHVLCLPMPASPTAAGAVGPHPWDAWLAAHLDGDWLATKPYTPLPVLGIPGWWPENENPAFYDNAQVFRPPRMRSPP